MVREEAMASAGATHEISATKMEESVANPTTNDVERSASKALTKPKGIDMQKLPLLLLNVMLMAIGSGGPLLTRVYFMHGGKRLWLSAFIETAGWPISFIPLYFCYVDRVRREGGGCGKTKLYLITPRIIPACIVLGVITGLDCYLYSIGSSYLPVSTSALLISTQLAFTALLAFLIVKQKFTPFSINAVFLLVLGAAILGLQSGGDRPAGVTNSKYYMGFMMTLAAAALYGMLMPLIELTYMRIKQKITYTLVMEIQLLIAFFGTIFCLVGMIVNKDFQAIPREASLFGLGEVKYYIVIIFSAIFWQCFNLGFVGVISCSSSLMAGVVMAVLLPIGQVLAVILLREKFNSGKGISLVLSLWGFASYLYGERKQTMEAKKAAAAAVQLELHQNGKDDDKAVSKPEA